MGCKMASDAYLRRRAAAASARGRMMGLASAAARERRALAEDGPVRGERLVRITVEDSLGKGVVFVARQIEGDNGRWSRFCVRGRYPVAASGLGAMVTEVLGNTGR